MLGKLTIDALPFYSWVAMGGAAITVGGALTVAVLITYFGLWRYFWTEWLTSVDHKRIGIMYVVLALIMLLRGFVDGHHDARPAGGGAEFGRLPSARALRTDFQLPRHDHDLLHGHAVPDRADQHRRAAADRRPRRRLPVPELRQPVADRRRRRAGHGLPRHRQILAGRMDGLSALFRHRIQSRRRGRLLALGYCRQRHRLDSDRNQFRRHHIEEAGSRHASHAHADVQLDGAVRQHPDRLCLPGPDGGRRDARPGSLPGNALFHQQRWRQHDELRQSALDMGASRGLYSHSAGLRNLFGSRRDILRQTAVRL